MKVYHDSQSIKHNLKKKTKLEGNLGLLFGCLTYPA